MNADELLALQAKASTTIDSEWHFAWHWEKNRDSGTLTSKGWAQAYADGCKLKRDLEDRLKKLEEVLPRVEEAARATVRA